MGTTSIGGKILDKHSTESEKFEVAVILELLALRHP